jgi:hypothetical protein
MCEPTFEEWFLSFAAERERLTGMTVEFDHAYDRYFPAFEDGMRRHMRSPVRQRQRV